MDNDDADDRHLANCPAVLHESIHRIKALPDSIHWQLSKPGPHVLSTDISTVVILGLAVAAYP
jgi:hypothetical protein